MLQEPVSKAIPQRKISETILDFGAPLLAEVHPDLPLDAIRTAFTIVITTWNAYVMAQDAWGHPEHLEALKQLIYAETTPSELRDTFEALSTRWQAQFADDPRVVGDWRIVEGDDSGYDLHCDARAPEPALQ
jgi:hypothetical protein